MLLQEENYCRTRRRRRINFFVVYIKKYKLLTVGDDVKHLPCEALIRSVAFADFQMRIATF